MKKTLFALMAVALLGISSISIGTGGGYVGEGRSGKPGQKPGAPPDESLILVSTEFSTHEIVGTGTLKIKALLEMKKPVLPIACEGQLRSEDQSLEYRSIPLDECKIARVDSNHYQMSLRYKFPLHSPARSYYFGSLVYREAASGFHRIRLNASKEDVRVVPQQEILDFKVLGSWFELVSATHPACGGQNFDLVVLVQSETNVQNANPSFWVIQSRFPRNVEEQPYRTDIRQERDGNYLFLKFRLAVYPENLALQRIQFAGITLFNRSLQALRFKSDSKIGFDVDPSPSCIKAEDSRP